MIKTIYLCGPINGCTDEEANGWRDITKRYLAQIPTMYPIDPMKRDYRGEEDDVYREIVDLDKLDIRNSDALLVYYEKPSVGTSMEIFYAWTLGKPIIIIHPDAARISPWLKYHSTKMLAVPKDVPLKFIVKQATEWLETI